VSGQTTAETKADPACVALVSRIEALRKDGIPDKIEKAAAKRYKMRRRRPIRAPRTRPRPRPRRRPRQAPPPKRPDGAR
jgi:hypothetical protein